MKRTTPLVVRVTVKDKRLFVSESRKCGLDLSNWMRMVMHEWVKQERLQTRKDAKAATANDLQ